MTKDFQSTSATVAPGFVPLYHGPAPQGFSTQQQPSPPPIPEVEEPPPPPAPLPEEVLQVAREQAEEIISSAHREVEQRARQASAEAREEQLHIYQAAAADLFGDVREQLAETLRELAQATAALVVQIARRVTAEHFQTQPEAIVPVVREALQAVGESARVRVIVAPPHEASLRQAYCDLAAILGSDRRLEITVDETASAGGCVVHGEHGSFDARLETRLQAVEQMVQETLAQQEAA